MGFNGSRGTKGLGSNGFGLKMFGLNPVSGYFVGSAGGGVKNPLGAGEGKPRGVGEELGLGTTHGPGFEPGLG